MGKHPNSTTILILILLHELANCQSYNCPSGQDCHKHNGLTVGQLNCTAGYQCHALCTEFAECATTQFNAQTAPPFIPTIIGEGGLDWPAIGAGTTLFLIPVMIFTVVLRKHLLRGITFGAVRK